MSKLNKNGETPDQLAAIVVEAAEKGGALITADIANSYNKDVFAIPGNIGSQYSEGCNKLIKTNSMS